MTSRLVPRHIGAGLEPPHSLRLTGRIDFKKKKKPDNVKFRYGRVDGVPCFLQSLAIDARILPCYIYMQHEKKCL